MKIRSWPEMIKYILKRLLMFIPILLGISIIVQVLIVLAPGDPARQLVGVNAEPGEYEMIREQLKLDEPIIVRYGLFLKGILKGDFGTSFYTKRPVLQDLMARWPYTVLMALLAILLATIIGIPLGIFAATHQYKIGDNLAVLASLITVSMPSFWLALLLVQFFSVKLRILPVSGIASWKGWILPVVSIAVGYAASVTRQMRSNMLEVVRQDFITTRSEERRVGKEC
jgi:peptide/nickel transport system permease protein